MAPAARTLIGLLHGLGVAAGLSACADDPRMDIRICGDFLVPPMQTELVSLADGSVVEVAREEPDGEPAADEPSQEGLEDLPIDALRITTRNTEYEPIDLSVLELDSGTNAVSKGFSRTVTFPRSDSMRWVTVEGLRRGVVAYTFARHVSPTTETIDMPLAQACFGVDCQFGRTCMKGTCELAPDAHASPFCGDAT